MASSIIILPVLLALALFELSQAQYPFGRGGGCGGGCPTPMCQPQPPCSAPPPMPMPICPPPPPCPPQFCPPPPICPPPPPPMPCPMPLPPPPPRPCPCMSRPSYYPQFAPQYYQQSFPMAAPIPSAGGCGGGGVIQPSVRIPAQNDCCCGCSSPCKYKSFRRAAFASKTVDPSCNSSELKNIILENIVDDASESKRNIQKAAEDSLGIDINVICGKGEFSYIAHTNTFCQTSKYDITCYAFKPL